MSIRKEYLKQLETDQHDFFVYMYATIKEMEIAKGQITIAEITINERIKVLLELEKLGTKSFATPIGYIKLEFSHQPLSCFPSTTSTDLDKISCLRDCIGRPLVFHNGRVVKHLD